MAIRFPCPLCNKTIKAANGKAGKTDLCPACSGCTTCSNRATRSITKPGKITSASLQPVVPGQTMFQNPPPCCWPSWL